MASEDKLAEYRAKFAKFDKNKDGKITTPEFRPVLVSLGLNIAEEDIQEMINKVDTDNNGSIEFDEFCAMLTKYDTLKKFFRKMDKDGNGTLCADELQQGMKMLDIQCTTAQIDEMIRLADTSNDGKISIDEFVTLVEKHWKKFEK